MKNNLPMKNKIIIILLVLVVTSVFICGLFLGYSIFKPQIFAQKVTSQTILETLKSQGFLVTQTYILNQKVTIDKNSGVIWKDIFWGQEIEASGVMKISSGIDLTKLTEQDISSAAKQLTIKLPPIEVQSVELLGDIELKNTQGILKKVFDNDDGYNLALAKLKEASITAANSDQISQSAHKFAVLEIERLLKIIAPDWAAIIL